MQRFLASKYAWLAIVLFLIQLLLILCGGLTIGKYWNPILLFFVSLAIPFCFLKGYLNANEKPGIGLQSISKYRNALWAIVGLILFLFSYEEFRKQLVEVSKPETISDVITQVVTLYERFASGEFPYQPISINGDYNLEPVYMPLTWLPIGLAKVLNVDVRWIGFGFLALVFGIYGWTVGGMQKTIVSKVIMLALPVLPFWAFILLSDYDLTVSYELVTGAYYLLLAVGLLGKNWWLIVLGIIACLLSRYTLLVWIPLFALLVFSEFGLRKSLTIWSIVAGSVLLFFIIPFYLKEPAFMERAMQHYHNVTVADWIGYGDPPGSWNQELGVSISPIEHALFRGPMEVRVTLARYIETGIILLLTIGGWFMYRRWRNRLDMFDFSLVMLYLFVFVVYYFSPLTFRYYYFSFLLISGIVCAKTIVFSANKKNLTTS